MTPQQALGDKVIIITQNQSTSRECEFAFDSLIRHKYTFALIETPGAKWREKKLIYFLARKIDKSDLKYIKVQQKVKSIYNFTTKAPFGKVLRYFKKGVEQEINQEDVSCSQK